jgi:hypothetical protein
VTTNHVGILDFYPLGTPILVQDIPLNESGPNPLVVLAFGRGKRYTDESAVIYAWCLSPTGGTPVWIDCDRLTFPAPVRMGPVMQSETQTLNRAGRRKGN